MRGYALVGYSVSALLLGCGGGSKKQVKEASTEEVKPPPPKKETEADREAKRRNQAHAIVPEGSSCLPVALKEDNAPRLELAAVGKDAIVCAIDQEADRLLGPVGCWKIDLASGKLEYKEPIPLPGRGYAVKLDKDCARGYCLPSAPESDVVQLVHNLDDTKVAVLAGEEVHLFDAKSKAHESQFSIAGDKGVHGEPKSIYFVADTVLVDGGEGPNTALYVFKTDGTPVGPVTMLGGKDPKPVSTHHGSVSVLDKTRVGVGYRGMESLNTYDVNTGARAKLVRKLPKLSCKPAEIEAYWADGDKVTDKCKASIAKASGHLMGATVVAGAKNFLVLLRGDRLGELAVMDAKSLAEKSVIKMPWCEGDGGGHAADEAAPAAEKASAKKKATTRGATQSDSADPQEGGE